RRPDVLRDPRPAAGRAARPAQDHRAGRDDRVQVRAAGPREGQPRVRARGDAPRRVPARRARRHGADRAALRHFARRVPLARGQRALRFVLPRVHAGGRARAPEHRLAAGAAARRGGLLGVAARDPVGLRLDAEPLPAAVLVRLRHRVRLRRRRRAARPLSRVALLPRARAEPRDDAREVEHRDLARVPHARRRRLALGSDRRRARTHGRGRARDRRGGRAARSSPGRATIGALAQPVRRSDERDPGRVAPPVPRGGRGGRAAAAAVDRGHLGRAPEHRMTGVDSAEPAVREALEAEARAAAAAVARLSDDAVTHALARAAELVHERRAAIARANADDVEAASSLDEGALDRLRLDDRRIDALGEQLAQLAELPPLDRDEDGWELENGLRVRIRRIPIGAVDVAGQLLKSLNAAVLRTGGAALRTVTVLVDGVLRPALADAGLPPEAVGLARSPDREGARILVSLPEVLPLVILRGSGETTAALAREAAAHGVRTLAHAEGGGVLFVSAAADRAKAEALIEASLDRLGVCNRLNLLLVQGGFDPRPVLDRLGVAVGEPPRLGHEWANDPERIASVTVRRVADLDDAVRLANDETSGLAAAIVTEDAGEAERFLDSYRGTAAFWNAPTRFTDGFALTGSPETGINVDRVPGPRGPVTYRDLYLRQYRVVGDGTQHR